MKTVFANTIAELKTSYTNLSIVLITISAASSFFTNLDIVKDNVVLTSLKFLLFAASGAALMLFTIVFLSFLEEYFRSTKLAEFSIAKPFTKKSDHVLVNIKTLLILISTLLTAIAIYTEQVSSALVIFWFSTMITVMFASSK